MSQDRKTSFFDRLCSKTLAIVKKRAVFVAMAATMGLSIGQAMGAEIAIIDNFPGIANDPMAQLYSKDSRYLHRVDGDFEWSSQQRDSGYALEGSQLKKVSEGERIPEVDGFRTSSVRIGKTLVQVKTAVPKFSGKGNLPQMHGRQIAMLINQIAPKSTIRACEPNASKNTVGTRVTDCINGAKIAVMSWDKIEVNGRFDGIIVASAGNGLGRASDETKRDANVLALSINEDGSLAEYNSLPMEDGPVLIATEGTAADLEGKMTSRGTGFAAPRVAAAIGRIMDANPSLKPMEAVNELLQHCTRYAKFSRFPIVDWDKVAAYEVRMTGKSTVDMPASDDIVSGYSSNKIASAEGSIGTPETPLFRPKF